MGVSLSKSALDDLENIKEHYFDLGVPEIGCKFVEDIFKRIETLIEHPSIGRVAPEFNEEYIRELICPPLRIVYLHGQSSVQTIRVWRSERLLSLSEDKS